MCICVCMCMCETEGGSVVKYVGMVLGGLISFKKYCNGFYAGTPRGVIGNF